MYIVQTILSLLLVNSEVALLRKQLTDSLEQISVIKKEKEKILVQNEALHLDIESLKNVVTNLETQLTHKYDIHIMHLVPICRLTIYVILFCTYILNFQKQY
jgi:hypothetical protein